MIQDVPPQPALIDLLLPRQQRWQEHITCDEHFERIIGLAATGRATVEAWQLIWPELMHLRRWL
jgi:hypothetical protein